jgi:ppGpp synthetase/RelA/SpoT-type nucleotidyltranferase
LADADATVTGRVKKLDSILSKLEKKPKYGTADRLQDTTGMRIVARDTASVLEHIERVKAEYEIVGEPDDYITKPQESGYRSWHAIVKGGDGQEMEIQIRTPNQNDWAVWAHDAYKPQTAAQAELAQSPEVGEYAHAMSEWMARQDAGEDPGPRPRASWKIQAIFKTPGTMIEY